MKRLQLQRWSGTVLSPRTCPTSRIAPFVRLQSTASSAARVEDVQSLENESPVYSAPRRRPRSQLPSPPVQAARESAKLAALHARLGLPARLPYETLARTLVDASADPNPKFNNESLASLGQELLAYYTSEHLICTFPRLPMTVVQAAMYAYVGPKSLSAMAREWGVELAAAPGGEVDAGVLQFKRVDPGSEVGLDPSATTRPRANVWRKSISSGVVYDDIFGDPAKKAIPPSAVDPRIPDPKTVKGVTAEEASATFVRALMGAVYLHAGRPAAKRFFREHFLSRHLDISKLFQFVQPTRDLGRLCAREGFEHPVARIISETGRLSRHPVYVVGIFSGKDKLGEGTGGSLAEARTRAAVAALKGWYLYSPLQVRVPSSTEEEGAEPWKPVYVDLGEVIV